MNLEKLSKYVGMLIVLLIVSTIVLAADPINPSTWPVSPVNYMPMGIYQFNITCDNINGTGYAWLSIDGHEYGYPNYSESMLQDGNTFFVTIQNITAGIHVYSFRCEDNITNSTSGDFFYNITKATPNISLSVSNNNILNGTEEIIVNCTGDSPETNTTLYRNGTDVTDEEGVPRNLSFGVWEYTCESPETQNYNQASESEIVKVYKIPTEITLNIDGSEQNKSFNLYDSVDFEAQVNITGVTINMSTTLDGWTPISNDTVIYNLTNITQLGVFSVTATYFGNETHALSSKTLYFDTVAPQYTHISPGSSESYEPNKTYWFNVSWDSATLADVWFGLKTGNENDYTIYDSVQNDDNIYYYTIQDSPEEGFVYYWCANRTHSESITNCTDETTFNISKGSALALLTFSDSSVTYGTEVNFTCVKTQGDSNSTLRFNTPIGIISSVGFVPQNYVGIPSEGTYTFTCSIDESQNYTSFSDYRTLVVTSGDFVSNQGGGDSGGDDNEAFTITTSSSSVKVSAGSSREITLTLKNTLGSDVTGIEITSSGMEPKWYSLDRTSVDKVRRAGGTEKIKLTFNIPKDAEQKTYTVKFKATGKKAGITTTSSQVSVRVTVEESVEAAPTSGGEEGQAEDEAEIQTLGEEETEENPTGFALSPDILPDAILIIGFLSSGVIYLFRQSVTKTLRAIFAQNKEETPMIPTKTFVKPEKKTVNFGAWVDRAKTIYNKYNWKLVLGVKKQPELNIEDDKNEKT